MKRGLEQHNSDLVIIQLWFSMILYKLAGVRIIRGSQKISNSWSCSIGGPRHAAQAFYSLLKTLKRAVHSAARTIFNFTFMEFDFCHAVICHPYCLHHQFLDSFINCYLNYTQLLYRAMKNTVEIGSEGGKSTKEKCSCK